MASTDPEPRQHALAPQETAGQQEDNDPASVKMRAGVTTGAMRWVLGIGLVLAVVALALVWGLTPTS